jgi:hypothetical protein
LVSVSITCGVSIGVEPVGPNVSFHGRWGGQPQEGLAKGRVLVASLLGKLPDFTVPDGLFAASEFSEGYFEVEVCQQFLSFLRLHPSNLFWRDVGNAGHQQRPMHKVVDSLCPPRR